MLVTITTDASYYHEYRDGGYAFWITSNIGRLKLAKAFKGNVESSHDAEFKCIINSLHYLSRHKWNPTTIYINTDSRAVMNYIDGSNKNPPECAIENLKEYRTILKHMGNPIVTLRHVKGHTHTHTTRNWVNDWCDKNAKAEARKKIFGGLKK